MPNTTQTRDEARRRAEGLNPLYVYLGSDSQGLILAVRTELAAALAELDLGEADERRLAS
jgi:hypothetical protein